MSENGLIIPPKPMITPKKTDNVVFTFTEQELIAGLEDPKWRLAHLYTIINKQKEEVIFRPNAAQQMLLGNLHTRNVILKARKMGFSSCIQILMLDTAAFSPNERCKVIAQDLMLAEGIFRDVFKFAYDRIPAPIKELIPTAGEPSKNKIEFAHNNSIVETTTSARGTTPTFLHVSELGKISAKDPQKSKEIITGSITSVAEDGIIFVESTAEGQSGDFYDLVQMGIKLAESGKKLWKLDFKFFFFAWFEEPTYKAPVGSVVLTEEDTQYFDELEGKLKVKIQPEQRAWYVKYLSATYMGDQEKMWAEMPSSPEEAFQVSMKGAYFADQFSRIRKENRIGLCPYDPQFPVSTFWDLGANDATAIWFVQAKKTHYAVIKYIEASGEPLSYFVNLIDEMGYVLGYHYLPHDAEHRRQGQYRNMTAEEMLAELAPHWRFWAVPRTPDKAIAIQQARIALNSCVFDESGCTKGIQRLETYRKQWNPRTGTWRSTPHEGPEENGADAFLQFAQAKAQGLYSQAGGSGIGGQFGNDFGEWYQPEADMSY